MPFEQPTDPAPTIEGYDDWWFAGKDDDPPKPRPSDVLLRGAGPATFQLIRSFAYEHPSTAKNVPGRASPPERVSRPPTQQHGFRIRAFALLVANRELRPSHQGGSHPRPALGPASTPTRRPELAGSGGRQHDLPRCARRIGCRVPAALDHVGWGRRGTASLHWPGIGRVARTGSRDCDHLPCDRRVLGAASHLGSVRMAVGERGGSTDETSSHPSNRYVMLGHLHWVWGHTGFRSLSLAWECCVGNTGGFTRPWVWGWSCRLSDPNWSPGRRCTCSSA